MKIGIASDHRGYKLKTELISELTNEGYQIEDCGTNSAISTDYPDYAFKLGSLIQNKQVDFGVAICGTGIGISIACNKVKGVRCAKVTTPEESAITRNDNDSNIVALSETTSKESALEIIKTFISTPFSEEEKHHRRVQKIIAYEENN